MRQPLPSMLRQHGAIAVMTGLLLILVLIPVGGLVLDLGHLYIVKSELQNLADAAALAAAKDLDNSDTGLTTAIATGKALARKNRYDFDNTMELDDANFRFASSPEGPWYTLAESLGKASGLSFVEVDTRLGGYSGTAQSINTYLMRIAGHTATATYGAAVAGRFVNTITPIGVCAIDPTHRTASYSYSGFTELVEFGFRRGMAYNILNLGSLSGNTSDPYLVNPINSPPNECKTANSSATATEPFMCTGNSAVLPTGVGYVYTNTGLTASLDKALNSRFNDYSSGSKCDPATAPPDANVREFPCKKGATSCVNNNANTIATTPPIDWMEAGGNTYPSQPAISTFGIGSGSAKVYTPKYGLPHEVTGTDIWPSADYTRTANSLTVAGEVTDFAGHGTLWSYTAPVQSNGTTYITPAQANSTKATSKMYGASAADYIDSAKYPVTAGTGFSGPASPYNQVGNSDYFEAPAGRTGQADRRILNIVLIDCATAAVGPAACAKMKVVGIGKFFMLTKSNINGGEINAEFTGLVEPVPTAEVKLYK
jgi:hypothetical protein